MKTGRTELVYSMQILRGLAALLIVLHHFNQLLPGKNTGLILFGYGGASGVDIFFLISGFVMVRSTENRDHARPGDFALRRLFRVVPLAQICTVLYFLLLQCKPSARVLVRSLFFIPLAASDPPKFGWSLIPQMWTLTYEVVFYSYFGASLLISQRRRVLLASALIFASIFFFQHLLGGPFSWLPDGIHIPPADNRIFPREILGVLGNPLMLEFIVGMTMAWAYGRFEGRLRVPSFRLPGRLFAIGLTCAFLGIYFSPYDPEHGILDKHGYSAVCIVLAALILEGALQPGAGRGRHGIVFSALMGLGAISYPLYLVHLGIVDSVLHYLPAAAATAATSGLPGFIVCVALSIGLAILLHLAVEKPFIRMGKRLTSRPAPAG